MWSIFHFVTEMSRVSHHQTILAVLLQKWFRKFCFTIRQFSRIFKSFWSRRIITVDYPNLSYIDNLQQFNWKFHFYITIIFLIISLYLYLNYTTFCSFYFTDTFNFSCIITTPKYQENFFVHNIYLGQRVASIFKVYWSPQKVIELYSLYY